MGGLPCAARSSCTRLAIFSRSLGMRSRVGLPRWRAALPDAVRFQWGLFNALINPPFAMSFFGAFIAKNVSRSSLTVRNRSGPRPASARLHRYARANSWPAQYYSRQPPDAPDFIGGHGRADARSVDHNARSAAPEATTAPPCRQCADNQRHPCCECRSPGLPAALTQEPRSKFLSSNPPWSEPMAILGFSPSECQCFSYRMPKSKRRI